MKVISPKIHIVFIRANKIQNLSVTIALQLCYKYSIMEMGRVTSVTRVTQLK